MFAGDDADGSRISAFFPELGVLPRRSVPIGTGWCSAEAGSSFSLGTVTGSLVSPAWSSRVSGRIAQLRDLRSELLPAVSVRQRLCGRAAIYERPEERRRPPFCFCPLSFAYLGSRRDRRAGISLDIGLAAGLFSGSMTASAAIGTATDADQGPSPAARDARNINEPRRDRRCALLRLRCGRKSYGSSDQSVPGSWALTSARRLGHWSERSASKAAVWCCFPRDGLLPHAAFVSPQDSMLSASRLAALKASSRAQRFSSRTLEAAGSIIDALPDTILQVGDIAVLLGTPERSLHTAPNTGKRWWTRSC